MTVQQLARKDHTNNVRKSGVAIAHALGLNYHLLPEPEQDALIEKYETAWWMADRTEVPA